MKITNKPVSLNGWCKGETCSTSKWLGSSLSISSRKRQISLKGGVNGLVVDQFELKMPSCKQPWQLLESPHVLQEIYFCCNSNGKLLLHRSARNIGFSEPIAMYQRASIIEQQLCFSQSQEMMRKLLPDPIGWPIQNIWPILSLSFSSSLSEEVKKKLVFTLG